MVRRARAATTRPLVAIGGITRANARDGGRGGRGRGGRDLRPARRARPRPRLHGARGRDPRLTQYHPRAMTARVLDGAATARAIREELRPRVAALAARGVRPGLGVLLVGDDPASAVYVRSKTQACDDLGLHPRDGPAARDREHVRGRGRGRVLQRAARDPRHPRPDAAAARGRHRARPAPGRSGQGRGRLPSRERGAPGAEAAALRGLHARPASWSCSRARSIALSGRRAVVLGRSDIVGKPMALLLMHADATVTVAHSKTPDLAAVTREADVLVAAVGRAGLVRGRTRQGGRGRHRRRHEPRGGRGGGGGAGRPGARRRNSRARGTCSWVTCTPRPCASARGRSPRCREEWAR